jgi:transmembrane sensor
MKELFVKYIKRACTKNEVQQIVRYFKDSQDLSDVPTVDAVSELLKEYPDIQEDVANRIMKNVLEIAKNNPKKSFYKKYPLIKYAAVAVLLLGLGHFYQQGYFSKKPVLVIPPESITLASENGRLQIINEVGSAKVVDDKGRIVGVQEGNQLVCSNGVTKNELTYNTLRVPYGKRFKIQLSDGTVVNLNSGTSLKYPVAFVEGENRSVFLDGEAFFDVATDKDHPFIVNAEALNIEVLGTKFNVSAYHENLTAEVVLVEGSVGLSHEKEALKKESLTLTPGTKGSFDKKKKQISKEKVTIEIYTQWLEGGLVFRNRSFENISKNLERHFNVKIANTNELLKKEIFNASFKEEPIEIILNDLKNSFYFEYKMEENVIYIH